MKNFVFLILLHISSLAFCQIKFKVDLIVHNANIFSVNEDLESFQAMAVFRGKIFALGTNTEILSKFKASKTLDVKGQFIVPGFIDAHAHFLGYSEWLSYIDLSKSKSWDDVIDSLVPESKTQSEKWVLGMSWDQNKWRDKSFPSKEKLDSLFPNRPVYLVRIDGHAAIINQKAIDLADISKSSLTETADVILKNGEISGMVLDKMKNKVSNYIPKFSVNKNKDLVSKAQDSCFSAGLTTVVDAGLNYEDVEELQNLHNNDILKLRLNVMLSGNEDNLDWLIKKKKFRTERLRVNGFKFYGDGSLGSRGACLLKPYEDAHHHGNLVSDITYLRKMAKSIYENGYQMSTHAIGDSTNRLILDLYGEILQENNDRRWRIEHAQIINSEDVYKVGKYAIIPSVQPTHAVSDMNWVKDRLGNERMKSAYAYRDLLNQNQWMPLGTDFPVEKVHPIYTFYSAIARKDFLGLPKEGFQKDQALTRIEALCGITIWAAKSIFEEDIKGSLEVGKFADFVILNQNLLTVDEKDILKTKVVSTFLNGEKVY